MMNSIFRNLFVWMILGSFLIFVFNNIENSNTREQISYSQFKEEILSDPNWDASRFPNLAAAIREQ